jgi:hypothetical protein
MATFDPLPESTSDHEVAVGDQFEDAAVDQALTSFASANSANPGLIDALSAAASEIKDNPDGFIDADGQGNQRALRDLVARRFQQVGEVTVSGQTFQNIGAMGDGDIMAMCFIVMAEAAKSAREDLKAIMDGVKAINKGKEGRRSVQDATDADASARAGMGDGKVRGIGVQDAVNADAASDGIRTGAAALGINASRLGEGAGAGSSADREADRVDAADIEDAKEALKIKLDSLSEMGEMESLRLQMAMDRLSKLMSTLSNMLKKSGETASAITQHIK